MTKNHYCRMAAVMLALLLGLLTTAGCSKQEEVVSSTVSQGDTAQADAPLAKMISTKYETPDTVVSAFNVIDYGADPTGQKDCTSAIKDALIEAGMAGGGTVWMPVGTYLVSGSFSIPKQVTLRGDWNDPAAADFNGEHGTVLLLKVPSLDREDRGTFMLAESSGIEGLTFYYPEQDIKNVKPYPFTVFASAGKLKNVRNCTFINAYRGIGTAADPHEMLMIKNVRATFLKTGVFINNSSDVGTVDGLSISPAYWAKAGQGMNTATAAEITAWCNANEGAGMMITDAEQQQYYNISVEGMHYGIYLPCRNTRFMGAGSFYRLRTPDCVYGVYAEKGKNPAGNTNVDDRWGYNIANSSIEGSKGSVINDSAGKIKLSGVTLKGITRGGVDLNSHKADLSNYYVNTNRVTKSTGSYFAQLNEGATEAQIQQTLDKAGQAGGGTVYLSAGKYEIAGTLKVPANVELKGVSDTSQRQATGTALYCRQSGKSEVGRVDFEKPLVLLNGDNAGISGIHLLYDENVMSINEESTYQFYSYAIKGKGKGVYCIDCCISGATHGVDFTDCDAHVITNLIATAIHNTMTVSGKNGLIANCLQNATVMYYTGVLATNPHNMFDHFFNPIGRKTVRYITVKGAENLQIINCFIYGGNTMLTAEGAKNLLAVNVGADNLGDPGTGVMYTFNGGSATVINSMRYNGDPLKNNGCALKIYNRMAINFPDEEDVK